LIAEQNRVQDDEWVVLKSIWNEENDGWDMMKECEEVEETLCRSVVIIIESDKMGVVLLRPFL